MFKAVITEETTAMTGTVIEKIAGLACYVEALKEIDVPEKIIRDTVELGLTCKAVEKEQIKRDEENKKIKDLLKMIFE